MKQISRQPHPLLQMAGADADLTDVVTFVEVKQWLQPVDHGRVVAMAATFDQTAAGLFPRQGCTGQRAAAIVVVVADGADDARAQGNLETAKTFRKT